MATGVGETAVETAVVTVASDMWAMVVAEGLIAPARLGRRVGSPGESRSESPGTTGGRATRERVRMTVGRVVLVAVLCAVVGMPQTASAGGSYGAVVEKGLRGCTTDPTAGTVICFESPTVSPLSRLLFLKSWRAAHFDFPAWGARPTTMSVRTVAVGSAASPGGRPPLLSHATSADLLMSGRTCSAEFHFRTSNGVLHLQRLISVCTA